MLECVINLSEGRDDLLLSRLATAAGADLLDVHRDPDHHRSVFTLVGTSAPRTLAREAVANLTLDNHQGVHPRLGVVDVVPFVPLGAMTMADALRARDEFAQWTVDELGVPVFLYGPERTLPEVRRTAWKSLRPDVGPDAPHETAGAVCVGARMPLVAWNMWLEGVDLERTKDVARLVRTPEIRTLGLQVGRFTQVSCNLVSPRTTGPDVAYDAVAEHVTIHHCELVGLVPRAVLDRVPQARWRQLDLDVSRTIEERLAQPLTMRRESWAR